MYPLIAGATITAQLFDGLHLPSDAVAIVDGDGAHTWEHIRTRALHGARRLAASHTPGTRIGLLLPAGSGWVASLLAIWRARCIAVPLTPRHPEPLRQSLLDDAGAQACITDADALTAACAGEVPDMPEGADVGMLLYTSGTTGRPKGAMLTHACLAAGVDALVRGWRLGDREALLHCLPLHHMHGIAIALLPCLCAGMRAEMLPRFDAETVWEKMASVDTFMAVPTMYHLLLAAYDAADDATRARWAAAARALGLATSGSAALPQSLAARWSAIAGAIPLERWGMTEIGVGLSNPLDPAARRRGWVGRPVGAIETRVADDGELFVRGPSVFAGYWERPDATTAAFADGWFKTGDVVAEEDGMFRIVGRRSVDIIKSGGYKIGALEVEEHLRDHPAIDEVAVVGVPDDTYGERVAAAIVLRAPLTQEALAGWARERLASYQLPRLVRFVDALPKNPVGKVVKSEVRDLLLA